MTHGLGDPAVEAVAQAACVSADRVVPVFYQAAQLQNDRAVAGAPCSPGTAPMRCRCADTYAPGPCTSQPDGGANLVLGDGESFAWEELVGVVANHRMVG